MFKIFAVSITTVTLAAGAAYALSYAHDDSHLKRNSAAALTAALEDQDAVILLAQESGGLGFSGSDFGGPGGKDVRDRDGSGLSTGSDLGTTRDEMKQGGNTATPDSGGNTDTKPSSPAPVELSASESEPALVVPVRAPLAAVPSRVAPRLSPPIALPMPAPSSSPATINFNPVSTGVLR